MSDAVLKGNTEERDSAKGSPGENDGLLGRSICSWSLDYSHGCRSRVWHGEQYHMEPWEHLEGEHHRSTLEARTNLPVGDSPDIQTVLSDSVFINISYLKRNTKSR